MSKVKFNLIIPRPIIALPDFSITALTSEKSRLTSPTTAIKSEID